MKLKKFTGLLLTAVMSAACITTGFAEDTADNNETYEIAEDITETAETEETAEETAEETVISEEEIIETEEPEQTAETDETVLFTESEEETESSAETGVEIDTETETNADLANTITYPVTGGSITINTSTGAVTKCDSSVTEVTIPSSYSGIAVTSIGSKAFYECTNLTSVTIPSSVTSMGDGAFYGCTSLTSVEINGDLDSLPDDAFRGCSKLKNINIPSTVSSVGGYCFECCSLLPAVTLPSGLTSIGYAAFAGCSKLTSITIPSSVSTIRDSAFGSCTGLKTLKINEGVSTIGGGAFAGCEKLTSVTIPSTVDTVGTWAFYECSSLKTLTVLSMNASFGSVSFKTSFYGCSALTTVYCAVGSTAAKYFDSSMISYITIPVNPPSFTVAGVFGGRNVTFNSTTEGAVIYYSSTTSNITTKDTCVSNGKTVLFEDFYGTIYARAYYDGEWSNVSRLILKIPVVNEPTITVSGTKATIKSSTPSAYIYYTTDGTTPSLTNGTNLGLNGGTITVDDDDIIKAIAVRSCFTNSSVASYSMPNVFDGTVYPPSFNVVGTFGGRNVTFASSTGKAKIYYSSTTSNLTTSDTCIENGETVLFENFYGTIYARAYYNGTWSNVSRLILKIPTINDPTITYENGKATIRTTTPNCHIYYTTDGTTPSTTNGKRLATNSYGQVVVPGGTTIKAIAVRSCFTNSAVTTYKVS
ncbi:MAG: leucine-rich repeat protein [Clostridiales bacterium]|nr:leucine-rich repeat protein [Clostridiales bacterium]